jgi:hypothetical protein
MPQTVLLRREVSPAPKGRSAGRGSKNGSGVRRSRSALRLTFWTMIFGPVSIRPFLGPRSFVSRRLGKAG